MTGSVKDALKDVLYHTHGLGIFEMVKIRDAEGETNIETTDPQKTVIVMGKTLTQVAEFEDSTVGLSRLDVLNSFLSFENFNSEKSSVKVVNKQRKGVDAPEEVEFTSEDGTTANYRFMLADVINQQLKEIKFKGAAYDLEIVPTEKNYRDLGYFESALGKYEGQFTPKIENGDLYFYIGDNGGDRSKVLIQSGVTGTLAREYAWPLSIVLKIMKLGTNGTIKMSFNSNKGLLEILINSGIGEYKYLLPSKG